MTIEAYESRMTGPRVWLAKKVGALLADATLDRRRFLQRFCGFGVGMTEPVEGWIRRAGERCRELGLSPLGDALIAHAKAEAGHHAMMLADLAALGGDPALAEPPWPKGVLEYRALHERVCALSPWGQLAIEYEIERLSVAHGPALLRAAPVPLSFVASHAALDVAHSDFNRRQLAALLAERPHLLFNLTICGERALAAYAAFLDDCMETT